MAKSMDTTACWLISSLILLVMMGCEQKPLSPDKRVTPGHAPDIRIIDGYLSVAHSPFPPSMVAPPASITVTEMYSRSFIFLDGDGSVSTSQKPHYTTEEGKKRLQAALADRSTMKLIIPLPKCPVEP